MDERSGDEIQKILVQLENEQLVDNVFIESLAASRERLNAVSEKWGNALYTSLLKSLTHEIYPPNEARDHWQAIIKHRRKLLATLGRNPGIAVVALDYLTNFAPRPEKLAIIHESRLGEIAGFATRDELTGLYVRKIFESVCTQQINSAQRYKNPLCLLMADIDDFKSFNDTHGHRAGDQVLERIGRVILNTIRDSDIAARYGGEELAIIAPKTELKEAFALAERLRVAVPHHFSGNHPVTLSIGIAQLEHKQTKDALVEAADAALYQAKRQGKNQCFSFQEYTDSKKS